MKKLITIALAFAMALLLTACGSANETDSTTEKSYNVVYKGDAYVLNEEGVLVSTLSNQANPNDAIEDDLSDEALDESINESIEAREANGGIDEETEEAEEEDDDIVEDKNFGDVSIISDDDGFYLKSKDGEIISKTYEILVDNYNGYTVVSRQPEKFVAFDSEGIHILDTDGDVTKTVEIHNVSYIKCYGNYFIYNVIGTNVNTACGVMDMKLKTLVEPSRYYEIVPYFIFSNKESAEDNDMLVAKYKDTYGGDVYDIINKKGEIIIDSALSFAYVNTDKIAILRGATVGFMDFDGEWLTKNPI